jgi:hypothetical protein
VSTVSVDLSDLLNLRDDLQFSADEAVKQLKPVVSKGALNIKRQWAKEWGALGHHITDLPKTIDYDIDVTGDMISAEIGPNKDEEGTQAPLGNLIAYGSLHSAPHPSDANALAAEEPRFLDNVGDVAEQLLAGGRG